jgi:hypothetical protein
VGLDIFNFVVWLVIGIVQISSKGKIEKSSYIIMWLMLMVLLVGELL